jgi:hypothetical protein
MSMIPGILLLLLLAIAMPTFTDALMCYEQLEGTFVSGTITFPQTPRINGSCPNSQYCIKWTGKMNVPSQQTRFNGTLRGCQEDATFRRMMPEMRQLDLLCVRMPTSETSRLKSVFMFATL